MYRILCAGLLVWAGSVYAQPNWRFVGAEAGRPGPVVKNAPFSADVTTETVQVLQGGNRIRQTSSQRVYRDSEGRMRREQSLRSLAGLTGNSNLPPVIFITDPVAGVNYALDPSSHTCTKSAGQRGWGGPQVQGGGRRMPGGGGRVKAETLARQTMEGIAVEGVRRTETIPAGTVGNEQPMQVVTETWRSPDLQILVLSKRSDPRRGETITRYTNITRGEPAHSLFEVPGDYKITPAGGREPRPVSK